MKKEYYTEDLQFVLVTKYIGANLYEHERDVLGYDIVNSVRDNAGNVESVLNTLTYKYLPLIDRISEKGLRLHDYTGIRPGDVIAEDDFLFDLKDAVGKTTISPQELSEWVNDREKYGMCFYKGEENNVKVKKYK